MCWVGRPFVGMGIGCGVWLSGGVVCGGCVVEVGLGLWGVGGCVWGGTGWGCIFFVWGVGFAGALGVGCYFCVMSAWGLGGEVVEAYLGAACFGGGEVGALVDAVDSFAGEGFGWLWQACFG